MRTLSICLSISVSTLVATTLQATIIHVPADSTTIQGGINGASAGDTVMVAPGTYYEHDIDFLGKAIVVMGTDPEDSAVVAATVVDADSSGTVFLFQSGEDTTSVLTGLTITGGYGPLGGGLLCESVSSPTISNNHIVDNTSVADGGGISCESGSYPMIRDNTIMRNSADRGGGIRCDGSSPRITGNIIRENSAETQGGGIYCTEGAYPIIAGNVIAGNRSSVSGGGIRTYRSGPIIVNNLIIHNWAEYHGGGISTHKSESTEIINNTIVENAVNQSGGGGGLTCTDRPTVSNCIIWDNLPEEIDQVGGRPDVTYSDIRGGWSGEGNIFEDPLFVGSDPFGYHLRGGSPCIDAGDPMILDTCLPPGLGEERSDMGVYGGVGNCDWPFPLDIFLVLSATGPTDLGREETLHFNTYIQNSREVNVEGDYWLSVLFPNSGEVLVPEGLLNYPNPLHGQVFGFSFVDLSNQLLIPAQADTGSYQLIGRIGTYPNMVIDEESFEFQVVE